MIQYIRRAAALCLVLLIALLVDAARVMVLEADELDDSPANRRIAITRWGQPRGEIVVDGRPVTGSLDSGQQPLWERTYTKGPLYAPVTGYASAAAARRSKTAPAPTRPSPAPASPARRAPPSTASATRAPLRLVHRLGPGPGLGPAGGRGGRRVEDAEADRTDISGGGDAAPIARAVMEEALRLEAEARGR